MVVSPGSPPPHHTTPHHHTTTNTTTPTTPVQPINMTPSFLDLVTHVNKEHNRPVFNGLLVCFDPGETTGYAIFKDLALVEAGQLNTKDLHLGYINVNTLMAEWIPEDDGETFGVPGTGGMGGSTRNDVHVVIEDYRVYGWKTDSHAWQGLHTPKFIGMLITFCLSYQVEYSLIMAHQAKAFFTDDKLRDWNFYKKGLRHARDAIRHGCNYLTFGEGTSKTPSKKAN